MADVLRRRSFVGRGTELARLRRELAAAAERRTGRTVVVGGEAGIGKSRLIAQFAADTGSAASVLEGACLEVAEDALPYAPFVEMLRSLARETGRERLPAVLGPGRAELTRLLPELASRAADLDPPLEPERASQARLFELLLGVFERLAAERPLVLVIEDIQWADRSTRDLVGFLSRALRDDPVLLLLSTRTDEVGDAVGNLAFLAELEREDHVDRIELSRFDRDEIAEQAASLLDEPPAPGVVDRLLARTDGNPFYVEELILAQGSGGATGPRGVTGSGDAAGPGSPGSPIPPVLRDVLAARVAGLSPGAREVLRVAAAAGRRIDDGLLADALERTPRDIAPALREALASGILVRLETPEGPVSAFRHALLQEVVDAELFPGERVALHAAFAAALERRLESGDRSVAAVEIARHWDGARQPARALPFTMQAAVAAEQVYAFAEAVRLWERAAAMFDALGEAGEIEGRDAAEAFLRGAECAMVTGMASHAAALAQRALVILYPTGHTERLLNYENRFRWYLWWSGQRAEAVAAVRAALAQLPADQPSVARVRALAQEAGILLYAGDFETSRDRAREAIQLGRRFDEPAEIALALGVLGMDLALLGDVEQGIEAFREGQAIAQSMGSVEGMALAATNLAALLDRIGMAEASLDAAREGYGLTERIGVARTYGAILLGYEAKAELALGRWDDADRSTAIGLRRGAVDAGAVWLQVNRARLLTLRGKFEEAGLLLRRAEGTEARIGETEYATALLAAEAELAASTGRLDDAMAIGELGLRRLAAGGPPDPSLAWVAALVLRAIADAGSRATSRTEPLTRQIEAAMSSAFGRPGIWSGERALALVALLRAESERAGRRSSAERWAEVRERWVVLGRPYQVAYAAYREAEALLAARGDREIVSARLAEAAGITAELGAAPLAGLVSTLAGQARISLPSLPDGARPAAGGGATRADVGELTAREAEVLRLVAAGWTNQQIADALFITRKTASVHVSNIMGKLGATNRGEAAALAQRLGIVGDVPLPIGHEQ